MLLYKEASRLAPCNIMHLCDYDGPYEEFAHRFHDYPGQVVNVPLSADGRPLSLREAAELFKRPVMGGIDRHGIVTTGTTEQVKLATLAVLKETPGQFHSGSRLHGKRKDSHREPADCHKDRARVPQLRPGSGPLQKQVQIPTIRNHLFLADWRADCLNEEQT